MKESFGKFKKHSRLKNVHVKLQNSRFPVYFHSFYDLCAVLEELCDFCELQNVTFSNSPGKSTCNNSIRGTIKVCLHVMQVTDLREAQGARPPGVQILSISCSFWEILVKSYVDTPRELAPPPRGYPGSATECHHLVSIKVTVKV